MSLIPASSSLAQVRCANRSCGRGRYGLGMLLFKTSPLTGSVLVEIDCPRCKSRNRVVLGSTGPATDLVERA